MASLISCPHCGLRPKEEFSIRGDANLVRPAPDAGAEVWYDYVYLRDNPKGRHSEYWHHSSGCRRWLIVERDTVTHAVHGVRDAGLSKLGGEPA
ncbi:sarcosine oxidase subunit delta [Rhizobium etli]|uniref:sarcosine oxidase subunit delta n=1 Tax=Rhizobium etli TaxID=29449 RepID=UPI0003839F38|nr:sarcosine oxidase subunit delta [Rhizobium etli]AGS25057.1 sarcosine oxidase delta subunit SoxD 2 [Rhizobium etli bv. mimosae str. Mim1]